MENNNILEYETLIYKKAIEKYGNNLQFLLCVEELNELDIELMETLILWEKQGISDRVKILEEITDSIIMLNQLTIMLNLEIISKNDVLITELVKGKKHTIMQTVYNNRKISHKIVKMIRNNSNSISKDDIIYTINLLYALLEIYDLQYRYLPYKLFKLNRLKDRIGGL